MCERCRIEFCNSCGKIIVSDGNKDTPIGSFCSNKCRDVFIKKNKLVK